VSQADPGDAKALPPLQTPSSGLPPPTASLEPGLVRISLLICGLMVLYGLAWEAFIDPVREGSWLWLKVIPLAVAVRQNKAIQAEARVRLMQEVEV
jgi:uncharacterized membrane protein